MFITCAAVNEEESFRIARHNFKVNLCIRVHIVVVRHQLEYIRTGWTALGYGGIIDGSFG